MTCALGVHIGKPNLNILLRLHQLAQGCKAACSGLRCLAHVHSPVAYRKVASSAPCEATGTGSTRWHYRASLHYVPAHLTILAPRQASLLRQRQLLCSGNFIPFSNERR